MTVAGPGMLLGNPASYSAEEEQEDATENRMTDLDWLSDDDSIASLVSAETLQWQHAKYDPELEMERGPPLQFKRGPPFATGHIIMCDPAGCGLQPGLVCGRITLPIC